MDYRPVMKGLYFTGLIFVWFICSGLSAGAERPVLDDGGESRSWVSRFRSIAETPAAQLEQAQSREEAGRFRRSRRAYRALVTRWPAAPEAAVAQHRYAELLQARGRSDAAFEAYQRLLDRYPHEVPYAKIMERQYRIALDVMRQRRMRFFFGGYRTPETALPLFAWIVEQAPGDDLAIRSQMKIGSIHEGNREYEKAIDAYTRVLQLFPGTESADEAAVRRGICLYEYSVSRPNDARRMDEAAFGLDYALQRTHDPDTVEDLTSRLDRMQHRRAQRLYERAHYYERNERNARAAAVTYRVLLREFPDIDPWSPMARKRLQAIEDAGPTREER